MKTQEGQLRIRLFGPPTFELDRAPLALPRRKVRALLCYLAASARPIPREHLCYLFWPDHSEAFARRNLTHLLTHLQRALPKGDWIASQGELLSLSSARVWVDVRAFEQCLPRTFHPAQAIERAGLPPRATVVSGRLDHETRTRLEEAVALYGGEFLAGFSQPDSAEFDLWATTERERWRRAYLDALALLAREYATAGEAARAMDYAQRYLAVDDLAEEMHRRLIELYTATGQRAAALRQYETCVAVLERELGVNPLPETQAAYQAARIGTAPIPARPSAVSPPIPLLEAPLIGRADALALLEAAHDAVARGQGRIVFLAGEAGIGKTRLAREFAASLSGVKMLAGGALASESKTPYFPLLAALRSSLGAADWDALSARLEPVWLAECARALPELRVRRRDLRPPPVMEPRTSRAQLFEALTRLVLAVSPQAPLLLFLDDLHWADDTTLAWLGTLARRIANERVLLLLAYRSDALNRDLLALREAVGRMGLACDAELNRFSVQEVTELIRGLAGQTEGAVLFSQRLHQETDGNPFFVLETLRALFDQAVLRPVSNGWETDWDQATRDYRELPLPESVRALLRSRLRALAPAARQVAGIAAVIGIEFDPALIQRASGLSEENLADALDELAARQIVCETHSPAYVFTHEKLQEEAYRELSSARRRLLHRRVGEALSVLDPRAVIALARHFEQAQDWTRAATYALRAGEAARNVFAHSEARAQFERALVLLESAGRSLRDPKEIAANQRMRIEALDGRGWTLRLLGEMDAYARDLDELARLARALGDRQLQAHACWRQAYAALWFCRYDQVARAAKEGIALSRALGDAATEMECVWTLALAARASGDFSRARRGLERAWKYFSIQKLPIAQVHLLSHLSTLRLYEKRYDQAESAARQALALCDQERLPYHRRLPLGDLGALEVERGHAGQARAYLTESLSIARQIADRTQEIFCLGQLGWLCLRLKNTTEAREHFTAALNVAQSVGSRAEQSWLYAGLAETHALDGNPAQAREAAQRAHAIAEELGQKHDQASAQELLERLL